jgi:hypothetical protein
MPLGQTLPRLCRLQSVHCRLTMCPVRRIIQTGESVSTSLSQLDIPMTTNRHYHLALQVDSHIRLHQPQSQVVLCGRHQPGRIQRIKRKRALHNNSDMVLDNSGSQRLFRTRSLLLPHTINLLLSLLLRRTLLQDLPPTRRKHTLIT